MCNGGDARQDHSDMAAAYARLLNNQYTAAYVRYTIIHTLPNGKSYRYYSIAISDE